MKKTFLNLRKMGFVLVAATSMLAFSCGGGEEEATDEGEATEEVTDEVTEECDGADMECDGAECDGAECDGADSTDAMECDGGEESCDAAE